MEISGTLHLYSGKRRELFFVFDDDVAQQLYNLAGFNVEDKSSREVFVSVGTDRFISRRTLSFSRKQTEIKVSLCAKGSKEGLRSLTALYNWYVPSGDKRPAPFPILGELNEVDKDGHHVWELHLQEPAESVVPPGLDRRRKEPSKTRRVWIERRTIEERDTSEVSRLAEEIAYDVARSDFPPARYQCHWRDGFYDSELMEVRELGIIADIDVWDIDNSQPTCFIEVKAQKVAVRSCLPRFYLSRSEWQSFIRCRNDGMSYQVWVIQYSDVEQLRNRTAPLRLFVFDVIDAEWLEPDTFLVKPLAAQGEEYWIE
jgi:hypothetical protein